MSIASFLRHLQGERPGFGSEFIMPDRLGETLAVISLSPSIAIAQQVLIPDVSYYQAEIDFVEMEAAGAAGVIIRAGQRNWTDTRFKENWQKAKTAGLPRGSYWLYDSREGPKRQAALWWSLIKDDPGELVHVADLEENYKGPYGKPEHFEIFLNEFRWLSKLPVERVAIYTAYFWWLERVGVALEFKQYLLWLAWYADMSVVRIPGPWDADDLLFWQYTSSGDGTRYGVSSQEIDLSWYCCSLAHFNNRFHLVPTNGGTMPKYEATAIGNNTNLRADHTTKALSLGQYPAGTKFHGDIPWVCPENIYDSAGLLLQMKGDIWLQVVDVNGQAKSGWVAIVHKGSQICTIDPAISSTPTEPTTTYADVPYTYTITLGGDPSPYEIQTLTGSGVMKVKP